ncbi:MAG TPA: helix-turn-helix transcriptional regulator [Candidatus Angelobacter sp.]|jgi:plasmid maintenance system antidote protein VapI|nr:helix-turn-helix transcriptional regulator [Candidatus Angelobacter sp.]
MSKKALLRAANTANRVLFNVFGQSFEGLDPRVLDAAIDDAGDGLPVDPGMTRCSSPFGGASGPQGANDGLMDAHAESLGHLRPNVKAFVPRRLSYSSDMAKRKLRGVIESIVGDNLDALMQHRKELSTNNAVGRAAKLPPRTVGRIRNAEVSCSLDTLTRIAKVFGVEPWHILVPSYDPKNPPVRTMTQTEREFYANTKKAFESLGADLPEPRKLRHPATTGGKP